MNDELNTDLPMVAADEATLAPATPEQLTQLLDDGVTVIHTQEDPEAGELVTEEVSF